MNIEPQQTIIKRHGGKGSGNWGHKGRPGQIGGSGTGGGRLSGGLAGLSNPTSTDIARANAPTPDFIKERQQRDWDTDGTYWRYIKNNETLKSISTPEDTDLRVLGIKGNRSGACYEYAAKFVMDNNSWDLVHGNLFPLTGKFKDTAYNHGWAEKGNVVYDGLGNIFLDKKKYYSAFEPLDIRRYSSKEMNAKLLKHKVWGDWD